MNLPDDLPVKQFRSAAAWNNWLSAHHGEPGAWLKIAKKGSGEANGRNGKTNGPSGIDS